MFRASITVTVVFAVLVLSYMLYRYYENNERRTQARIEQALKSGDYATVLEIDENHKEAIKLKTDADTERLLSSGDFQSVLKKNPQNRRALALKAETVERALAAGDYEAVLLLEPDNEKALEIKHAIETLKDGDNALVDHDRNIAELPQGGGEEKNIEGDIQGRLAACMIALFTHELSNTGQVLGDIDVDQLERKQLDTYHRQKVSYELLLDFYRKLDHAIAGYRSGSEIIVNNDTRIIVVEVDDMELSVKVEGRVQSYSWDDLPLGIIMGIVDTSFPKTPEIPFMKAMYIATLGPPQDNLYLEKAQTLWGAGDSEEVLLNSPSHLPSAKYLAPQTLNELLNDFNELEISLKSEPDERGGDSTKVVDEEKPHRSQLLQTMGGSESTERSVVKGLEWLKRNQQSDGMWSLLGAYADGAPTENRVAATAMALLAFQGHGSTHQDGPYKEIVAKAWNALLEKQDAEGNFFTTGGHHHRLYTHAMATMALCELYRKTDDLKFKAPAQKALDYCYQSQSPQGGWRYAPGGASDTSVTSWFVSALNSAYRARLDVPAGVLLRVEKYLDTASTDGGSKYAYIPGQSDTLSMTAAGLLSRQYIGWTNDNELLRKGVQLIAKNQINFAEMDVYYWYYATKVLRNIGGVEWFEWNRVMSREIPANQLQTEAEAGSWDPHNDSHGDLGGRLYTTCLCIYMLESYYSSNNVDGYGSTGQNSDAIEIPASEEKGTAVGFRLKNLTEYSVVGTDRNENKFGFSPEKLNVQGGMIGGRFTRSGHVRSIAKTLTATEAHSLRFRNDFGVAGKLFIGGAHRPDFKNKFMVGFFDSSDSSLDGLRLGISFGNNGKTDGTVVCQAHLGKILKDGPPIELEHGKLIDWTFNWTAKAKGGSFKVTVGGAVVGERSVIEITDKELEILSGEIKTVDSFGVWGCPGDDQPTWYLDLFLGDVLGWSSDARERLIWFEENADSDHPDSTAIPFAPKPAKSNLTGVWKNDDADSSFRYKQNGDVLTVDLVTSETMSYLAASFRIVEGNLISTSYTFRVKNDPVRRVWRGRASGRIVDESTILMTQPEVRLNEDGSIKSQGTVKAKYLRFEE
ncbi:terpene cyclase/mutase family protein [Pirellulaceae bacterium]|nr:terpene cyclase/mutase family protein [Pirellulaceae bacterium]